MSSFTYSTRNQESESIFNNNNDSNRSWIYDVFLSFCDKGTGKSFASYLHTALTVAGVLVFRNDAKLRNGDQITPSVLHAIEGSRISIVIFSKNYADSTWCLQELEKIMECHRTIGQMVVPVFYDVDPSGVPHHEGMIGEAFKDLTQRILKKDESMCEVSNISGFVVDSRFYRNESKDIKNVVQHATRLLDKTYLFVADYPVGVESRVQEVIQLLDIKLSEHTLLVGICGVGGIGKTTIAKAIYNQIGCSFEAKSFLLHVGRVWNQNNGRVSLQGQLLSDMDKTTKINTIGLENILKERLLKRRIFLVLDDVRDLNQFYALCGSREWFGQGSRIIITTRNIEILRQLDADHVFQMKTMDRHESLELFSWHAFKQRSPIERFGFVTRDATILYSSGMPLALQVIGSLLSTRRMKSVLYSIKIAPNDIMGILRISFNDLIDEVQKIFLDIALNLIGMDRDDAIQILKDSGYYSAKTGISFLVQQSLVTVDSKNRIGMHDVVHEFGREIIRENSLSRDEQKIYDVFLSFRGEDSRTKFTSHLHTALQNAGLYVFKDDDVIQRGDQISVSLLKGIRLSRISIIVLSKNYANSRWCMLELETIMEIGRAKGLVVVPVFYEVDPSEVRHQTGKFGEAFEYLISRISDDERKRNWKTALLEVSGIAGVVVINSR